MEILMYHHFAFNVLKGDAWPWNKTENLVPTPALLQDKINLISADIHVRILASDFSVDELLPDKGRKAAR